LIICDHSAGLAKFSVHLGVWMAKSEHGQVLRVLSGRQGEVVMGYTHKMAIEKWGKP
jgi:hypothetical protein